MDKIIVDYAYKGEDWVKGYILGNTEPVYKASGIRDFTAIKLYNEAGKLIEPVPAPPTFEDQLRTDIDLLMVNALQAEGIL